MNAVVIVITVMKFRSLTSASNCSFIVVLNRFIVCSFLCHPDRFILSMNFSVKFVRVRFERHSTFSLFASLQVLYQTKNLIVKHDFLQNLILAAMDFVG